MKGSEPRLQRFWCPRDGKLLLGSDGYLVDPLMGLDWGHSANPEVQAVDLLTSIPCLILLGEPGIGKTTTFLFERESLDAYVAEQEQELIWIDLHEVGSEAELRRRLFDSDQFTEWKRGNKILNLFLDSLDECRVQVNTLPSLLIRGFETCQLDRLRVRIACRTADWPASLESGLKTLWGDDAVSVVELAPLRRADVEAVARSSGVDAHSFLAAVRSAGAESLAIKPLTLKFLIRTFQRSGNLPARQARLYEEGCLLLCEDSEGRQELRLSTCLEAGQRLAIAKRIAALTVFVNLDAVSTRRGLDALLSEDLGLDEISGGKETANSHEFVVTQAGIQETLNTGLFSSRGEGRLGWAHRTYAEFLAASYVAEHGLPLPQVMSLIVHQGVSPPKLVPQLSETVAWLSGLRPDVFRAALTMNPEVLLRSDMGLVGNEDRAALAGALLQASDAGEWFDHRYEARTYYAKLRHPGLADQVRQYIFGDVTERPVRRVAIAMAEACELKELLPDLVTLVLNPDTPHGHRVDAAHAISNMEDQDSRAAMKLLVTISPSEDPGLELRGVGLKATWPGTLSTKELMDSLVPAPERTYGAYRHFLHSEPIREIPATDLPVALEWARQRCQRQAVPEDIENLVDAILVRAWPELHDSSVLEAFGEVALIKIRNRDDIFNEKSVSLLADMSQRRLALVGVIRRVTSNEDFKIFRSSDLVSPSDATWLLERYQQSTESEKRRWAKLFRYVVKQDDVAALDRAWVLGESDPILKEIVAPLFEPIGIHSEAAQRQRDRYYAMLEWMDHRSSEDTDTPESRIPHQTEALLSQLTDGDLTAWWRLNLELMRDPGDETYMNELESDLTITPGWLATSEATRTRVIEAAERYVHEAIPEPDSWIDWEKHLAIYPPDWAGYRALRLIQTQVPHVLDSLSPEMWARWAPVIVAYPMFDSEESNGWLPQLVDRAYEHAPNEILDAMDRRIDAECRSQGPSIGRLLWMVEACWDDQIEAALLARAQQKATPWPVVREVIETLLDRGSKVALDAAFSLIPDPVPLSGADRDIAIAVATALMKKAAKASWSSLWARFQADEAFAEEVFSRISYDDRHSGALALQLGEDQVADLYVWLRRRYPPEEDPTLNGHVTSRSSLGMWRDSLLGQLGNRGTVESCAATERIVREFPDRPWLKITLVNAHKVMRQRTWKPLSPQEILTLVESAELRFVQTADQLQEVVIESLARLGLKLQHNEPPAAIDLWDEQSKGKFRPKLEERLSDYVKRHLDEDLRDRGIIFNREVTNRPGQETDIRVEALVRDTDGTVIDRISLIVEVKGCWNPKLTRAMQTQLVDRYLAESSTTHGIYLVGWYNCEKWDPADSKWSKAPRHDRQEAQRRFDEQALTLSTGGRAIRSVVLDTSLHY